MTHAELTGAIKALEELIHSWQGFADTTAEREKLAVLRAQLAAQPPAVIPGPIDKKTTGIYGKFRVQRTDGTDAPGGKHHGCNYFVLDLDHDKFAKPAMAAYANACETEYPALAADCRKEAGDAAQPPAVDRERRLREAVETALEAHLKRHSIDAKLCSALTAALADQPPPDPRDCPKCDGWAETKNGNDCDRCGATGEVSPPDPREAALAGAEAELDLMWKATLELEQEHEGSEYEDEPNYCDQGDDCAKCAIYAHFNNVLEYIRAARGKA